MWSRRLKSPKEVSLTQGIAYTTLMMRRCITDLRPIIEQSLSLEDAAILRLIL